MRRVSKERLDTRRELAMAVIDYDSRASATAREKANARIRKAARALLGYVLTTADKGWLDKVRPTRRRKQDDAFRQLALVDTASAEASSAVATAIEPQPPCVDPECPAPTAGIKRYDGRCAPCADRADHGRKAGHK